MMEALLPFTVLVLLLQKSIPIISSSAPQDDDVIPSNVASYLSNFGYLPPLRGESANRITEAVLRDALKSLQDFAGLKATGRMDADTKSLLATKRCGIPDSNFSRRRHKRYVIQGSKWERTNLTYKVVNWTPDLGPGRVRRIVHESLKLWSDVSALTFTETLDPNADIRVEFERGEHGDGYPFDGQNVVLAHAFFPGSDIGGDAHFDDDESWTDQPINGYSTAVNLYSVAAHEFGHSLGLSHSRDKRSLMYPYYRHTMRKRSEDTFSIGTGGKPVPEKPVGYDTTTPAFTTTTTPLTTTPTTTMGPPSPCASDVGAVSRIRNEIFIFKGNWFWRFDEQGYLVEDSTELGRFWYGGLQNLTGPVDAVYERKRGFSDEILFFTGDEYWVFEANRAKAGYPKKLTELGLPPEVGRIDAAFVWKYNGRTYFFAGDEYWRFDENMQRVELTYPRKMSVWKGVPTSPDAVFTDHSGDTYFFKADQVYKFNAFLMNVERNYPIKIRDFWTHCSPNLRREPRTARLTSHGDRPFPFLFLLLLLVSLK